MPKTEKFYCSSRIGRHGSLDFWRLFLSRRLLITLPVFLHKTRAKKAERRCIHLSLSFFSLIFLTYPKIFGLVTDIYVTLLLHLLVVKDGWKVLEQLQVLLRLSEDRGQFSAKAVARAFNCALLSALSSDPQIIARSVRDPVLLENCIFVFSFFLFLYTPFSSFFSLFVDNRECF
jgi:hypothetical protein